MRIAADSLAALMVFCAEQKPRKPQLENCYVTKDAKWLCAANGSSLALAAISDAEASAGVTLSGVDAGVVARAWAKHGDATIPFAEGLRLDGLVAMTPDSDDSLLVRYVRDGAFPDPSSLIDGHPLEGEWSWNVHGSRVAFAVPSKQLVLVTKAMARTSNIFVYPHYKSCWFAWQKTGHIAGDFRVLVLGANPAVWPKED